MKRVVALFQGLLLALSMFVPVRAADGSVSDGPLPLGTQAEFLHVLHERSCSSLDPHQAMLLAQSGPGDEQLPPPPAPLPTQTPTTPPTPDTNESPSAQPTPTFQPAPGGPGVLVPPNPTVTGTPVTPPPIPTPTPFASPSGPIYLLRTHGTPPPLVPRGATPSPTPAPSIMPSVAPSAAPSAVPTLGPNQFAILADTLSGSTAPGVPGDAVGNVHLFYSQGVIVAERAHYDGLRTVKLTGHPYVLNHAQDTVLYSDEIDFDTVTQHATLVNGRGATVEGVEQGELYYTARTLTSDPNEVHGDHLSFTTCLKPHGGYHVEARSFSLTGNRLVARKAVVFLGPMAIFFIPVLVIPIRSAGAFHRRPAMVPQLGYDQYDGFFVKAQLGFGSTPYYNGYYRVDYFTKRGLGLGYVATIAPRNGRRLMQVNAYTINDRTIQARTSNINLTDTENFSQNFRGNFSGSYNSNFGPNITLPASLNINGSLVATGARTSENLTFTRNTQGSLSDQTSLSYTEQLMLTNQLRQAIALTYAKTTTSSSGTTLSNDTFHINTQTDYTTKWADYLFTIDKTDTGGQQAVGYDTVPALQITPHINFHNFRYPFQTQFTYGYYTEPQNAFATERADILFNWPIYVKVFNTSDLSATLNVHQDLYGTGDAKADVQETVALTTPIGRHIVNAITYNDSYPMGPLNEPFQLLDQLPSATKQAQDVLRFFNSDVYMLSLSTGTGFNRQAQPISYQLNLRPSPRSYLVVGGSWVPGPGNGFFATNVQAITGFGRNADLQFTTNIDWKNKGRLENKNVYYRITVDDCYQVLASYNQDVKQFTLGFNLLAFPSHTAGFGIGGQNGSNLGSILPQTLAF